MVEAKRMAQTFFLLRTNNNNNIKRFWRFQRFISKSNPRFPNQSSVQLPFISKFVQIFSLIRTRAMTNSWLQNDEPVYLVFGTTNSNVLVYPFKFHVPANFAIFDTTSHHLFHFHCNQHHANEVETQIWGCRHLPWSTIELYCWGGCLPGPCLQPGSYWSRGGKSTNNQHFLVFEDF